MKKMNSMIITEEDIANLQITTARELIAKANVSNKKEEKIKSLVLAFKSIEASLKLLGVDMESNTTITDVD